MSSKPKRKIYPNKRRKTQKLRWSQTAFKTLAKLLKLLCRWLLKSLRKFAVLLRRQQRWDKILVIFLMIFWLIIIIGYFFFPGSYAFEGNLIVKEMSFNYTGQTEKLFLQSINNIKNIDLQGIILQPITLTGSFSSSEPELNEKLAKLTELTIELKNTTSNLIFTPANSPDSEIEIQELRLHPASQVNQLTYNSKQNQLSFCLQESSMDTEACLSSDILPLSELNKKQEAVGNLKLYIGQKPLIVNLAMVNIPALDITDGEEISLQFAPQVDELFISILSPTHLFIDLPENNQSENAITEIQWLRGDIEVSNVSFSRFDTTNNVTDEIQNSTILEGQVRMGSQKIELQPNQFLIVLSKTPGIKKIRNIQIKNQSPQGLNTLFFGESKGVAVGLYPEFPLQKIELSWLSKHFSQEATNSILAFLAACTGILLPRLFPEP